MSARKRQSALQTQSLPTNLRAKGRRRREKLTALAEVSSTFNAPRNDMLPELEFVQRSPIDLISPARKVRKVDAAHITGVANSIRRFGFCNPPLIDKQNCVLDGVIRVEASKHLGLTTIPCIRVGHLSADELRLVRLALNRLSEKGLWDFGELKAELQDLIANGVEIEASGFTAAEVDNIVLGEDLELETSELAPAAGAKTISRIGDVFCVGRHRVVCADATQTEVYAQLMMGQEARLVLTDEPYNVSIRGHVTRGNNREFLMGSGEMTDADFAAFNDAWMMAAVEHLREGGLFATFIDWRGYPTVHTAALKVGLTQLNLIVWAKDNGGMGSLYRSQHELLPLYKKGKASHVNNIELGRNGRWRSNLWKYPGASSLGSDSRNGLQVHPTVKPVAMLEDALLDITKRDDIVLDPFLGSGSTLVAAERCGRRCHGIELDPLYVDLTLRRFGETFGKLGVLEKTGETLSQLERRRSEDNR